ncbi:MAG: hypothetical protein ACRC92_22095 [Peptostreptococcaceae bacterium]
MKTFGVIDIGSNSIKLLICNIYEDKFYRVAYEEKIPVRLSNYLDTSSMLSNEGMDKLNNIMIYFKNICSQYNCYMINCVATETMRRIANSDHIINLVSELAGVDIKLLSGEEEAYFGFMSSSNTFDLNDYLQIDIGGSSVEIVLVKNRKLVNSISLSLGAIPITNKFNLQNKISKDAEIEFKNFIFSTFDKIPWLKDAIGLPIIGIGGSVRVIGKLHRNDIGYKLNLQHNYSMRLEEVNKVFDKVRDMDLNQKLKLKGLSAERADIFGGCLIFVKYLMDYTNSNEIIISKFGIREGIVFSNLDKNIGGVLNRSIASILVGNNILYNQYDNIYNLAITLSKNFGVYSKELDNILNISIKLQNIGKAVDYNNFYKHSMYFILNNILCGVNHKEQVMSCYILRFLQKGSVKLQKEDEYLLSTNDIETCKIAGHLIHMSSILNNLSINLNDVIVVNGNIQPDITNLINPIYYEKLNRSNTYIKNSLK